jgi:hypothetical protein
MLASEREEPGAAAAMAGVNVVAGSVADLLPVTQVPTFAASFVGGSGAGEVRLPRFRRTYLSGELSRKAGGEVGGDANAFGGAIFAHELAPSLSALARRLATG